MRTTKQKVERVLKDVEMKFYDLQQSSFEEYELWYCSPHHLASERVKNETTKMLQFIDTFTAKSERGKKYREIIKTLVNLDYHQKIEDEKLKEETL